MIKIIIADDQMLFRSMLAQMLIKDSDIEIIALCANSVETMEQVNNLKPDMLLLDIGMPDFGGLEVLRRLKSDMPDLKIVMLTTFEDEESIKLSVMLGADGYFIKEIMPNTLISAIKNINDGMVIFHQSVYKVLQSVVGFSHTDPSNIGGIDFESTDIRIIKLVAKGKSNKEIAALLNYSEGTIKNKVSKILANTGLADRTELSVFAIKNQII